MQKKEKRIQNQKFVGWLFKSAMIIMSVITLIVMIMTFLHINDADIFDGPVAAILLAITALVTAVCLCVEVPKGSKLYKFGFYILHGGVVVLLCGFLLSGLLGESVTVRLPVGDKSYGSIYSEEDGVESETKLGFYIGVTKAVTEYYTDEDGNPTANPKHYEATVAITDGKTMETHTESLTVNHPIRVKGNRNYKIYLMSFYDDETTQTEYAVLLMKADPAEYTILVGIWLLVVGSFFMCYVGQIPRPKWLKKKEAKPTAANEKGGDAV